MLLLLCLLSACSATRLVPDGSYLLERVEIKSDGKDLDVAQLEPYIRQRPGSKLSTAMKKPFGHRAPLIFDTLQARQSVVDLTQAMNNMGYMHSSVKLETQTSGKRLKAIYTLHPGEPYYIGKVTYDIRDSLIKTILDRHDLSVKPSKDEMAANRRRLQEGDAFTVSRLDDERERITQVLRDSGFFRFNKEFIQYEADSSALSNNIHVRLILHRYRPDDDEPEMDHPRYLVRRIAYEDGDSGRVHLRRGVLRDATALREGQPFDASALQRTYNNFGRMQAIRYTSIRFAEVPDSNLLDCNIQLSTNKQSTISFQPEGTNTAGDLGAAASLTYQNRNIFRGSELLSIELRGAYEAITGLEGYRDENYEEYSVETKLSFPRFVAPFLSQSFRRRSTASTEFAVRWDLQNRPEFHRRVFSTTWRYRWSEPRHHLSYRLDLLDINYIKMPWISETFKREYLDSVSNRNAILRYNYEDLLITKLGFGITYNNGTDAVRANIETSGNTLNAIAHLGSFHKNDQGQYTLFNIAYAQYIKFDFDYTRLLQFDKHHSLALHTDFGIAWPYGNSSVLPFEKRYFAGGPNGVRGWSIRGLGPGKYQGRDGRIDFINQTGDMKLDLNAEYRMFLFWKFNAAVFVDAGNIWTLRNYPDQPGGQFKIDEFYKQIAAAYGVGIRLNFDYFLLRFDLGMKAVNPAYNTSEEHWAIVHPNWHRDATFHFAVGLPF